MFGLVEIGGRKYVERMQVFTATLSVTVNNQILNNQRTVLPGVAPFWLKGLGRDTVVSGASAARRFRFRLGNTDGAVYYTAAGVGGNSDLVLDNLIFGDARFPYPVLPPIFYGPSASILYDVEDISANAPYTIYFAFYGSYLFETSEE